MCARTQDRICSVYRRTNFSDNFVILQNPPTDVHAVVIPICPGHLLVDIGVDARHGREAPAVQVTRFVPVVRLLLC